MDILINAIDTTPIIDHHAHNLLLPEELAARKLLSITSEAEGEALNHTKSTLSHMRAVRQLSDILGCEPDWESVEQSISLRRNLPSDAWAKRCFEGIETVLVDDGLDAETVHPWNWHSQLTRSECKRIVRIEKVAEGILHACVHRRHMSREKLQSKARLILPEWITSFETAIRAAINDPDVAGFKSVICYRTGLAIPDVGDFVDHHAMEFALGVVLASDKINRLENDVLSPFIVHLVAKLLTSSPHPIKPLQFHTGLGDNDISLTSASPSHLQPFIETYPQLPIVLLHASYPFTKEAGYLASVYENVYMDIGEVFPFVSQDGQEKVIRESLELCPSDKLTWSTDGHWFPETYLLAVIQVREGLKQVLRENVLRQGLKVQQAVRIVEDVFFNTSNRLYNLNLQRKPLSLTYSSKTADHHKIPDVDQLPGFLEQNPSVKFLRIQWLDYTATPRVRVLPIKQAVKMFEAQRPVSITKAALGLLQVDIPVYGCGTPVGEWDIIPVFSSLRLSDRSGYAVVQGEFREKDGSMVLTCPRTALVKVVEQARSLNISFLVGFEIEVVFLRYKVVDGAYVYDSPTLHRGHSWCSAGALRDPSMMKAIEEIVDALEKAQIELLMFHPESAPGQYEFVTGPLPPLEAADALLATKEIICSIGETYGFRATCIPKPVPHACGTGAHAHISLSADGMHPSFYAGVLKHLRSLAAFTLSGMSSYERVLDSAWGGGRYVAWGTQNRETPLRKIDGSHWELKCMDGLANPYLALAAILGVGLRGVLDEETSPLRDCRSDPALMSEGDRRGLGITEKIPADLLEALQSLDGDETLREVLGDALVDHHVAMKRAELTFLEKMDPDDRRRFMIERY